VYVEEVPGTPPIAGVGTNTAGFIGVVPDDVVMPLKPDTTSYTVAAANTPTLVTNFEQFKSKFGIPQQKNELLAHAAYGFFLNGGSRCYVIRIKDLDAAAEVIDALKQFEKIDEIAIVAAPGALKDDVQKAIIDHCELLEDRFAIIDGQQTKTITEAAIKGPVAGGVKGYVALYFPWFQVTKLTLDTANNNKPVGGRFLAPPSGHIAGLYARVDETRGVHKAPANEIVRGALELDYLVSREEQKGLNPKGINVIRGFDGRLLVWGARTLGGDANGEFKYINVRRLMNFLRESIDEGTQFVVFEPNNQVLWGKITRTVGAFLTNVWRDGALFGATPAEAFYVKCDETTNPPEVRDLGQVVTEIGVAIVRPAEFVIFRISQVTLPAA
jgi:phage tail sheath protein FI